MRKIAILFLLMVFVIPLALSSPSTSAQDDMAGPEILWDSWGVPHIFAENNDDLFYAFGYSQMNNHADLILSLYARARGETAAYWGDEYLDNDVLTHTIGTPDIAQEHYDAQNPEFKAMTEAFVDGMNAYAETHPDNIAPEMQAVLPVRYTDPYGLAYNNIVVNFVGGGAFGLVEEWSIGESGSNAWAIAPERSESGNTLMILNPHLPWSDLFVWFEAHLVAPDYNFYGATLVGLPGLEIGFNDNIGWTHTVNTYDGFDVYELTLTENGGYMLDGEEVPLEMEEKVVSFMGEDGSMSEYALPIYRSEHGPIVAQGDSTALALRVIDGTAHVMEQWLRMGQASNLAEFEEAMAWLQLPMFNTIYGDREGNIYYLFNARVPVRDQGDFVTWQAIQDGSDSSLIWDEYHPYEDLPKVINPPEGFVQNANEPPWTSTNPPELAIEDFPPYIAPQSWYDGGHIFRPQVSSQTAFEDESISYEELLAYKHNTHVEATDHVLDDLIAAAAASENELAQEAAAVLSDWDRMTNADSQGALLFVWWFGQYAPSTGGNLFAVPFDINDPYNTPSGLADPDGAVAALVAVAEQMQANYGVLDVPYGDVMRIRVGEHDLPGNGGSDPNGVFRAAWYAPAGDGTWQIAGGDSWFVVLEFSDPLRAQVLVGQGNATQPGSPHVGDQSVLFSEQTMREAWLTRDVIEANLELSESLARE